MTCELRKTNGYDVIVDSEACKDCGYCLAVCPKTVFSQADVFNAKGYRPVRVNSSEKCIGCRRCFFACPDFAIDVKKQQGEEDGQ